MAAWDVSRISSDSDVVPPADCMDLNCSGSNSGNLISIGRYWGLGITPSAATVCTMDQRVKLS